MGMLNSETRVVVHPSRTAMGLWVAEDPGNTELRVLTKCCESWVHWKTVGNDEIAYCADCGDELETQPKKSLRSRFVYNEHEFGRQTNLEYWAKIWTGNDVEVTINGGTD